MTDEQKKKMTEAYVEDIIGNTKITDDEFYLIKDAYTDGLNARDEEVSLAIKALEFIANYPTVDKYFETTGALNMKLRARHALEALEHTSKKEK